MNGTLYIVGTPIGNLKDITLRALETLKTADIIACEDTRHTRVLLSHYGINTKLISYHQHNERTATEEIKEYLNSGKSVALVTDAGMPGICDPGAIVISELRQQGFVTEVIPSATALTSAVSLAGIKESGFVFLGFLPEKLKDKDALLESYKNSPLPLALYCAPHDLNKIIDYLYKKLGNRVLKSVKEITKLHETVYTGTLSEPNIENIKGEFVLIVEPPVLHESNEDIITHELKTLIKSGMPKSEAVKEVAKKLSLPKNTVYEIALSIGNYG
ncbi:MAG: 16S rRNA (cytidine(1402)-2'-O)-methyltransferase [Firmicutes bacterium]|nr:16S rRNA (cytidine(1402)-2'-O)-methyltransferase [Bacillota bacterium]